VRRNPGGMTVGILPIKKVRNHRQGLPLYIARGTRHGSSTEPRLPKYQHTLLESQSDGSSRDPSCRGCPVPFFLPHRPPPSPA
jgi:hypothetical protein